MKEVIYILRPSLRLQIQGEVNIGWCRPGEYVAGGRDTGLGEELGAGVHVPAQRALTVETMERAKQHTAKTHLAQLYRRGLWAPSAQGCGRGTVNCG